MCNLLQSSTTTPVTPFYSLTSPTYQPYPRATATPTGPIPPHITPHGTPSTPTIPPSPSTPHPPKLKVTVREMVEGNNIAENSVEFPVFSITSIKHEILLLTLIACIILSYALFFTLSNTHTQRQQLLIAQEMFKESPTAREQKALILGFMAGARGQQPLLYPSIALFKYENHSLKNVFSKRSLEKLSPSSQYLRIHIFCLVVLR